MRQLLIQVPHGQGERALKIAQDHQGANLVRWEVDAPQGRQEVVLVHVSNRRVEELLADLQAIPELRVTLFPRGVMALQPPPDEAPQQVTSVEARSPIEIFLSGLQSVGSWGGFLAYAALAGVVVWIGLLTNTAYLLVAAMLIAPFASPAMNVAMGTARGDRELIGRGTARYFASLAVTITVSGVLTWVMGLEVATDQMVRTSEVSTVAVLLPLAAGAAGALNLVQSERNSLVSGAAVGMLVAASLAPPAGLIGMAAAIREWEMAIAGVFLLAMQLLAINTTGALVFRQYGLTARGARYTRGTRWIFPVALAATVAALGLTLWWQFRETPDLQRASLSQRATAEIADAVGASDLAYLVESNVRFTRADIPGQNTLLAVLYVQRREGVEASDAEIRSRIRAAIRDRLQRPGLGITPLVSITVLDPP